MIIKHHGYAAIQFDFYIPEKVWSNQHTQAFFRRIQSIETNATVFDGLTGVWQGEKESTRVYRVAIPARHFDRKSLREAFQKEIELLLVNLADSPEVAQQSVLFTESELRVSLSTIA